MGCVRILQVILVAVLPFLKQTRSQYVPDSPCPTVFKYERDFSGGWHGIITVPNPLPFLAIDLIVSVYITDRVPSNSKARLELVDSNAWQNLAAGDRNPVLYRLDFPLPSPLPTIKDITINDEVICTGVKPNSNVLTTLTIKHAIYNDRCSSSSLQCPFNVQGSGGKPISSNKPPELQFIPVQQQRPPPPSSSSSTTSPCPEVFSYQLDSNGNWYGLISIPNPYPIVAIDLRVGIYLTEYGGGKGGLELVNNLRDEWRRMRTGEKYSVQYRLTFPLQSPLPTVKSITANNQLLCTGNKPDSSILQTFSYQHGIYNEKCSSSSLDCPYNIITDYYPLPPEIRPTDIPHTQPRPPQTQPTQTRPPQTQPRPPQTQPRPPQTQPRPPQTQPRPPQTQPRPPQTQPPPPQTQPQRPPTQPPPPPTQPPTPPPQTPPPTTQPRPQPVPQPVPPPQETPPQETPPNSGSQCGKPVIRTNPLIFFGQPTVRGQWPWHAAIYHLERLGTRRYICGGSFIGTRSILTAAHCVTSNGRLLESNEFLVYLGKYDLRNHREEGSQDLDVNNIFVHPEYNSTKLRADVAIMILAKSVSITEFVRPVCLWNEQDISLQPIIQREGVVVGWGLDENSKTAEMLKMVKMPIVDQQKCLWSNPSFFPQFTSETTFCAGFKNGSSVCNGDSGGGLVLPQQQNDGSVTWMLRGIVSNSKPRDSISKVCDTKNYIIFTDAAQYLNWISVIYI